MSRVVNRKAVVAYQYKKEGLGNIRRSSVAGSGKSCVALYGSEIVRTG